MRQGRNPAGAAPPAPAGRDDPAASAARALAGAACLALLARPAPAVDYTLQAEAAAQQNYNSNLQMLPASFNPQGIWGSELDVKANFAAAAPAWAASAGARFDNWFYYPASGLDMQNQYVNGSFTRFLSERSQWGLSGSFASDALLSSQTDPAETQGVIFGRVPREARSLSSSFSHKLDEHTGVNALYSYSDASYPGGQAQTSFYPASTTHTGAASLERRAGERLTLDADLSFTDYATSRNDIKYVNFMAGGVYTPGPNTRLNLRGGGQYTQTTSTQSFFIWQLSEQADQLGPVFELGASHAFERANLSARYSRSISPSINGNLFTSDRASLDVGYRPAEKLSATLRLGYTNNSYPPLSGAAAALQGRSKSQTIYQVGAELSYALGRGAALNASYSYQLRDLGTQGGAYAGTQDAQMLSLSLRYSFDPLHF